MRLRSAVCLGSVVVLVAVASVACALLFLGLPLLGGDQQLQVGLLAWDRRDGWRHFFWPHESSLMVLVPQLWLLAKLCTLPCFAAHPAVPPCIWPAYHCPPSLQVYDWHDSVKTEQLLYKLDVSWPRYSEYFTGQAFGVAVDPVLEWVYVAQRGENVSKVLVFMEDGSFLTSWETTTIEMPHGIFAVYTGSEPSVWITDVGNGKYGHTIKQYSPSGDLLQVLGTPGRAGSNLNPLQFDQPAEIFVDVTGEFYIVDGDGGLNNRLLKLSQDFEILWFHGENGTEPAHFYIPHSVALDSVNRVWVADRGNKRIQVFDKVSGEWLGSWNGCFSEDGPYSVRLSSAFSGKRVLCTILINPTLKQISVV
ncbi:NHL repeat-containing protein 3 isoform X2 [Rhinatrema bivittatum]|uniref:NHL repeat-containing protein 3 isoform X2 n=1 Tax=Rhinatrema bivittatum TaxID=194408 RepID=UPI00112A2811|nr:NHL repeat-containing protein 3 isoform X2 [Rhinatrema bivittatum]